MSLQVVYTTAEVQLVLGNWHFLARRSVARGMSSWFFLEECMPSGCTAYVLERVHTNIYTNYDYD